MTKSRKSIRELELRMDPDEIDEASSHRAGTNRHEFFLDTDLHWLFQQVILQITLCSKQRLCSKRAFAPAVLLCPQANQPLLKQNTVMP
jgi:hypothetical protein